MWPRSVSRRKAPGTWVSAVRGDVAEHQARPRRGRWRGGGARTRSSRVTRRRWQRAVWPMMREQRRDERRAGRGDSLSSSESSLVSRGGSRSSDVGLTTGQLPVRTTVRPATH